MKNILIAGFLACTFIACNNNGNGSDDTNDSANPASDTTNLNVTPGTEDPNSNMADTMKMRDSIRVKDTSVKDKTGVKH